MKTLKIVLLSVSLALIVQAQENQEISSTEETTTLEPAVEVEERQDTTTVEPIGEAQVPDHQRNERSLLKTFPFILNKENDGHEDHGDHAAHEDHGDQAAHEDHGDHAAHEAVEARPARQGSGDGSVSFDDVAGVRPDNNGKKCINKVEMVEETEYEDSIQCDHSYDKRCHTTYVTNYESQQEEECEENFRKSCFIDYEKAAFNETVEICRTPLVKDCNIRNGPQICTTLYESECWTKQEVHEVVDDVVECKTEVDTKCEPLTSGYTTTTECSEWPREVCSISKKSVKKYTPITGCTKEPRELCAEAGCGFVEAPKECYEKTQTVVQDVPKEECTLEPQRTCNFVTKLVPKLSPKKECVDVPKEVCTRSRINPRKVSRPVIKKWCYIPSAESGLA